MKWFLIKNLVVVLLILGPEKGVIAEETTFDENYVVTYGNDHLLRLNQGTEIQLSMDLASGTGFKSTLIYGSGYFRMDIKLPQSHSPSIVTAFYLTSLQDNQSGNHDELDFEFLGCNGPPFKLQTNIFANDNGGREQRINLWFDPTQDFHQYAILWNSHQIVFFVDNIPIRAYKNLENMGARYPTLGKFVLGSIWNGEEWASSGRKVDWPESPFESRYRGFDISGCEFGSGDCSSESLYWWNARENWELTPKQQSEYENAKKNVYYDYCTDRPSGYIECQLG